MDPEYDLVDVLLVAVTFADPLHDGDNVGVSDSVELSEIVARRDVDELFVGLDFMVTLRVTVEECEAMVEVDCDIDDEEVRDKLREELCNRELVIVDVGVPVLVALLLLVKLVLNDVVRLVEAFLETELERVRECERVCDRESVAVRELESVTEKLLLREQVLVGVLDVELV